MAQVATRLLLHQIQKRQRTLSTKIMSQEPKRNFSKFARLSGIGVQMGATIFLGAYLGRYLDQKYPMDKKWFTIGLTLLAVGLSLYNVLRQVNKMNEESDND